MVLMQASLMTIPCTITVTSCEVVLSKLVTEQIYTPASCSDTLASTSVLCTVYGSLDVEVVWMIVLLLYHVTDG